MLHRLLNPFQIAEFHVNPRRNACVPQLPQQLSAVGAGFLGQHQRLPRQRHRRNSRQRRQRMLRMSHHQERLLAQRHGDELLRLIRNIKDQPEICRLLFDLRDNLHFRSGPYPQLHLGILLSVAI
ncbi:hypothetical protein D3C73_1173120 [compost metagenome]